MPPVASEGDGSDLRSLAYTFAILVLGLVGILVGVVVIQRVPPTVGGAIIALGYVLVYVGFLGSLYLDLRGGSSRSTERPFDGESG